MGGHLRVGGVLAQRAEEEVSYSHLDILPAPPASRRIEEAQVVRRST